METLLRELLDRLARREREMLFGCGMKQLSAESGLRTQLDPGRELTPPKQGKAKQDSPAAQIQH